MLSNSSILITGGTGSFAKTFVPLTIEKYNPKRVVIFSRDEIKQWELAERYSKYPMVDFIIGDVRDKASLRSALNGIDYVVHAAATKIVPTAEYNPFECVKTNIFGAMNVIDACIEQNVKKVVALSTDKASNPINLYGATKLASDKLFISANSIKRPDQTTFSVVRYGNVMGSRGSVIPFFLKKKKTGSIPLTDPDMTRFMITLEDGVELVWKAFDDMMGGEIYVKKLPSMSLTDIAAAAAPDIPQEIIGVRPGEKLHEQMIGIEDAPHTYSYDGYFKILPQINGWSKDPERIKDGGSVSSDFVYSSEANSDWLTVEELQDWIANNFDKMDIT